MVFVYLGDIWLEFVCYLGGICVWVVWICSVWLQCSASISLVLIDILDTCTYLLIITLTSLVGTLGSFQPNAY